MKKELNWRLSKLPTVEELLQLVKDKIITQKEAKEVLFNEIDFGKNNTGQTESSKIKELQEEIKFLRDLIEKLSLKDYGRIVEIIETSASVMSLAGKVEPV